METLQIYRLQRYYFISIEKASINAILQNILNVLKIDSKLFQLFTRITTNRNERPLARHKIDVFCRQISISCKL